MKDILLSTKAGENLDADSESTQEQDESLLNEFRGLWAEASDLWDRHQDTPAFHGYVSGDYVAIHDSLAQLRGRVSTVLEWGSGLGVVTIMASRMGFEAYGIEAEPGLVEMSETLAETYGSDATFAQGSFIPDEFEWEPELGDEVQRTMIDVPPAYEELDMELRDFDLVYAYPWPNEHSLFRNIIRQCGGPGALLLSYDGREGIQLVRCRDC